MKSWIALALVVLPGAALAEGPSFSCAGALSVPEAAICAAPELALADRVLETLYRKALAEAPGTRARQRAFLKERDICGDDLPCLRDAYGRRIAELGGLAGVAGFTPLRWAEPLEGIQVSGLWNPQETLDPPTGLTWGPALFELVSEAGRLVLVAPEVTLADAPPLDGPLELTWGARAEARRCDEGEGDCFALSENPFDLQDLDFDGKPEAVIADARRGQRDAPLIWAFSLPEGRDLSRDHAVFGRIDGLTLFDRTRRKIVIMNSNGACNSSLETYPADRDFALVQIEAWSEDGKGCHIDLTRIAPDGSRSTSTTRLND